MGISRQDDRTSVSKVEQFEKVAKAAKKKAGEKRKLSETTEEPPVKKQKTVTVVDQKVLSAWFAEHKVEVSGVADVPPPTMTFDDANLTKRLVKKCHEKYPGGKPTPIQAATWPCILAGFDVKGIAKTGSGKTLCFGMPFLVMSERGKFTAFEQPTWFARMVCMAPTRELTMQIATVIEEFAQVAKGNYPVATLVGGVPKGEQLRFIKDKGADIICATPGRLQDLADSEEVDLSNVQLLVLDEADRMLDLGFVDAVKRIASLMPAARQTVLFSATWPAGVDKLAKSLLREGQVVKVSVGNDKEEDGEGHRLKINDKITQVVEVMDDPRNKFSRLVSLLKTHEVGKVLVFALYKKEAARLEVDLRQKGFRTATALQGDMAQDKRTKTINDFRSGAVSIMIATDVASRGLDVPDIDLVINYTFPLTIEDFVHRVGRTGRAGRSGKAITLFNAGRIEGVQDEKPHAGDLVRMLKEINQPVPAALEKIAGSTGGNKATKKKAHALYGNFCRDEAQMAKLEAKKTHVSFDSDDE